MKEINFWESYQVNEQGEVFSKRLNKKLKGHVNNDGYLVVGLRKKIGSSVIKKNFLVHRLIAQTFISNPEMKGQVNHKDRNKLNNSVDNLEWCSMQENIDHYYSTRNVNVSSKCL